jgi:hypothetical protein
MKTCILALVSALAGGVYAQLNDPCILCPDGATVDDDYVPYFLAGLYTTCGEYVWAASLVPTGSEDCSWYIESIMADCCFTAPENPTDPAAMTPAPTPTVEPLTDPSSGCASVSELVFTFTVMASSICVIALV